MRQNLDELKNEIAVALETGGFAVFHGMERIPDASTSSVRWDTDQYPDPGLFLQTGRKAGVKIVVFHHRRFETAAIEEAIEDLESAGVPREQQRDIERRLRKFHDYDGFTCMVEMSFLHETVWYYYQEFTPWFDEFLQISGEIHDALYAADDSDEDDRGPMGSYFSHN
jgi:hypothetical protein